MSFHHVDDVPVSLTHGRVYEEGWQSWSPTTWYDVTATSRRPESQLRYQMRYRAGSELPGEGFHAEGLLVVDPGTGAPARVYGAANAVNVPSIRAKLEGDRLLIMADGPVEVERVPEGGAAALVRFGDRFAADVRTRAITAAPSVWCTWYRYFTEPTEADILENLAAIERHNLPVDVVQIDDGWECGIGDWTPSGRFTGLPDLAARIRQTGRRAGIWLAPFMAGANTDLARNHPEWLIGETGYNWDQNLHGLDVTHPGVRDYLWSVFRGLREDGFDYFKLDFLYAGAVPGQRYEDMSGVAAYRSGLELIRDAVGPESFVLGCGAPILPSVGLVDGMRVSSDTFHEDAQNLSTHLRGEMATTARAWQHGRFWINDPDCFVGRPSFALREQWASVIEQYGGLRSVSDRIAELDTWGLETTRRLLAGVPASTPFPDS
ncbi:glycoside hydrolase family 36 protein [Arthrobacter monumenti]